MSRALNMAVSIAASSFYKGGNWGFILEDNDDYSDILNILQEDKNIVILKVSNGSIVFCDFDILYSTVSQVESEISDLELFNIQKNRASLEKVEFQKFLTGVLRGTSKYGIHSDGYSEFSIGLYSCNTTNKIRLNGVEYPAYSLTLKEAIGELVKLQNHLKIYINTGSSFEDIERLMHSNTLNLSGGLEISNTLTGVFLTIRILK